MPNPTNPGATHPAKPGAHTTDSVTLPFIDLRAPLHHMKDGDVACLDMQPRLSEWCMTNKTQIIWGGAEGGHKSRPTLQQNSHIQAWAPKDAMQAVECHRT